MKQYAQYVKYAAVALAGYLIGFYEMKYKVVKAIANGYCEKESTKEKKEEA